MATSTLLTIDDFERLPPEMAENHELVDGELIEVSGNTPLHNRIKIRLILLLAPWVKDRSLGEIFTEQEYDFAGNAHGPDISFLRPGKQALVDPHKRVQRFVPDFAIEIASESDTYLGLLKKKERYRAAGTQEVWLISSETQEVTIYSPEQNRILRGADLLSTNLIPGFSITVDEVFQDL